MPARATTVTNELTSYEVEQMGQIAAWKSKPINPFAELWNVSVLQAAKLVTFVVPHALVRLTIESSYRAAQKLAAPETIAGQAGVKDLTDLRKKPLDECDRLAQDVANTARALATIEGAVTGVGGPLTTFIDVPLLFISALRTFCSESRRMCNRHGTSQPVGPVSSAAPPIRRVTAWPSARRFPYLPSNGSHVRRLSRRIAVRGRAARQLDKPNATGINEYSRENSDSRLQNASRVNCAICCPPRSDATYF